MFLHLILPMFIWVMATVNMAVVAVRYEGTSFWIAAWVVSLLGGVLAYGLSSVAALLRARIEREAAAIDAPPAPPSADGTPQVRAPRRFLRKLWLQRTPFGLFVGVAAGVVAAAMGAKTPMSWWGTAGFRPRESVVDLDGIMMYVPPSPPRSPDLPKDLAGSITRGERMMRKAKFDPNRCLGDGEGYERCLGSYLLAAVNGVGALLQVEVMRRPDGSFVSTPGSFSVIKESGGGFNVSFRVSSPPGWTVVALRRPYRNAQGAIVGDTYVPYSPQLDTSELVEAGADYLALMLTSASRELRARGVRSRHLSGKLVTDVGTNDHVAALVLTEWVYDPDKFLAGGDRERTAYVNRTLVMLAANRGRAFRFGQSDAGALGIAQVMPGTATGLVWNYPEAGMAGDVTWDRADHQQSLKLSILHADDQLWVFQDDQSHFQHLLRDPRLLRLVLAAGYNCKFGVVDEVIHARGAHWRQPCDGSDPACRALPSQTRQYLDKYEYIYDLLFDRATHESVAALVNPPPEPKTE